MTIIRRFFIFNDDGRYFSASGCVSGTNYGGLVQAGNAFNLPNYAVACSTSTGATIGGAFTTALNQFTTVTPVAATSATPSTTLLTSSMGTVFLAEYDVAPLVSPRPPDEESYCLLSPTCRSVVPH